MRARKTRGIVFLSVMLATASSLATGVAPTEWPLERIIANLEERLRVAPDDSLALYNLGRAHAFAFALERSSLWAVDERGTRQDWVVDRGVLVEDLEDQLRLDKRPQTNAKKDKPPVPTPTELLEHLAAGVRHLRRACEIEEKDVYWAAPKHLTLAWLLETGAHLADRVDTPALFDVRLDNPPSGDVGAKIERWIGELGSSDELLATAARDALSTGDHLELALPLLWPQRCSSNARRMKGVVGLLERYWLERAIEEYWQTFELAVAKHIADNGVSVRLGKELGSLVSYEAIASYRRLVQQRGVRGPEETARLAKASEQCEQLDALPHSVWMTPLLLSLDGCKSLQDLTTPDLDVPFDLDGDGVVERWPWIAPDAGWLVWDPHHRGEITSGQQLFGSASAWLFFSDGYRVLDALDDDRDGALRGRELAGIRVWFDRDTDGVSDRGEVVSVEDLGIVALSTQSTLALGRSPTNLCGVELADGRVLPTYDWVLEPVTTP